MIATRVPPAPGTRALSVHAAMVGVGWFVVAFGGLVGLQASAAARGWLESWPEAVQGMGGVVVLVAAVPLAWPVYIAIGLYETGLASRLHAGDETVRGPATRIIRAQAALFLLGGATVAVLAWLDRGVNGGGYLAWAWLPLVTLGELHTGTARRVSGVRRTHGAVRASCGAPGLGGAGARSLRREPRSRRGGRAQELEDPRHRARRGRSTIGYTEVVLDADSAAVVLDALSLERRALITLLAGLEAGEWDRPTECPAYTVKGIATHLLGDDLSLLSRQRDESENGLLLVATEMAGADLPTILDAFNDRWVTAARFLSTDLVIELLRLTGDWTDTYHRGVDPLAPGEPVGFFGARGGSSPAWHAFSREYVERWAHHSQVRRALGLGSLAEDPYLRVGIEVAAAAAAVEPGIPDDPGGRWALGAVVLGPAAQAADILTRAHGPDSVRRLASGPPEAVDLLASFAGRP